jgi:amidase
VPVYALRRHASAKWLANIERDNLHGLNLRAVLQVAPPHDLLRIAQILDDERRAGTVRSEMHGIPILVKWVESGLRHSV